MSEPMSDDRTAIPGKPPFTVDDMLKFPEDGNRYELLNGSLLVSPAPTPLHQDALLELATILRVASPPELKPMLEVNLRLGPQDYYIPDLVVVSKAAMRSTELMFEAKDILLAVEIVSPSTQMRDRQIKKAVYAAAGIPLYWRIELLESPSLFIYQLGDEEYDLAEEVKAGDTARLSVPFPVEFDPIQLVTDWV
ncbi:Uma2 family endonuclease [Acrocarpospora pleiomorpha]